MQTLPPASSHPSPPKLRRSAALLVLLPALALPFPLHAQAPDNPAPAAIRSAVNLAGPWRFHTGDDPRFADPSFDDSSWDDALLGTPLAEQGIDTYTGYAWYRLHLDPSQLRQVAAGGAAPQLLISSYSVGQLAVYVNGVQYARTRGMTDHPVLFQSPPFFVQLPATANGEVVIAIRSWASLPISHGLLAQVLLGSPGAIQDRFELEISRTWDRRAIAGILASFLFLCVAALGAILHRAQRSHWEYLWLALLCASVSLRGCLEVGFTLAAISLTFFNLIGNWTGFLFIVSTLEFVYLFTGKRRRRLVRGTQIASLLVPIALFLPDNPVAGIVPQCIEVVFLSLVFLLLFGAWRRGQGEAGVMLVPFSLAAIGDLGDNLLQFAVQYHWLPETFLPRLHNFGPIQYSNSTVSYLLFLASLLTVILYRFIRVSQDEQRSSAEIEAARSVQAMLIPTTLPSSRNFVLESAYLPANGVGGDFFQALPLHDDSMLIVVGDVSGKGLQAAMNASTLVGAFRNELSHDPATVLSHLNKVMLGASSVAGQSSVAGFATCLCARVFPSGEMQIANAGHLNPYRDGRELELAACLPLGIVPNIDYEQSTFQLKQGDRLTFLSDGVVEATSPKGELFGFERTQQVSHESARYIAQIAQRFGQTDDITVVSLYFVPAQANAPLLQSTQ